MASFRDTIYSINGSATGFDNTLAASPAAGSKIPVTLSFCRNMHIEETFAAAGAPAPQGLQVQFWNRETSAWGPTLQYAPGSPIDTDDFIPEGMGQGGVLGLCAQANFFPDSRMAGGTSRAADTPIRIISGTVTATVIKVRESQ